MTDQKSLGDLVKEYRVKNNITQAELAAGIFGDMRRKGDISKIENNKAGEIRSETIKKISIFLEIPYYKYSIYLSKTKTEIPKSIENLKNIFDRNLKTQRLELETLASRFEIPRVYDLSDAQLWEQLELRAADYRRFQSQIEAIDERTGSLGSLKAAARDAAERLDFAEVEALLSRMDEVETEIAAETKVLRADNALLRGRAEEAFVILSTAADSFGGIDALEPARRRLKYEDHLYSHGLRYGGVGIALAGKMIRAALEDISEEGDARLWARAQTNLGKVLAAQGERLGGAEGAALLGEAMTAFRAALRVWTKAAHPVHWATTQTNLGNALAVQGERLGGAEGSALLGEAMAALCAALQVRTEAAHPVEWAMTRTNLGKVLAAQGERLGGAEGAALLGEAMTAFRAALRVWTKAAHPVHWATTQTNLGNALAVQGERLGGAEGAALLGEAMAALCAALQVRTEAAHPVEWAMTTANLGLVWESLAETGPGDDSRKQLQEAVACLEAALGVFDLETMRYNHDKVAADLARVRAKLAGLPDPA